MESDDLNATRMPPGARIGPWLLLEQRGHGTYGVVYRAVHAEQPDADSVALKLAVYREDARFAREAELLSRIHHPAVPRLVDFGHWLPKEGVCYPWLVMEWVEGMPLYAWAQAQRLSSRQVLQLLARLARALEATHAAGAVHRDVKGDNVRVRTADGQPFLVDFGSGHYVGAATLTQQPFPPNTPAYRAPELWRFVLGSRGPSVPYAPGPADDVFALGVTAFRLATGQYPPLTHPKMEDAWLWRPKELSRWTARVCNPRCAPELSALVSRMLSPQPEARGSAREVAQALEKAARRAGRKADEPLFTGEEPQPAGLSPVPQHITVPRPPPTHEWPWFAAAGFGVVLALSAGALLSVSPSEELSEQEEAKDAGTVAVGDSVLTSPVAPEKVPSVWTSISQELPQKPFQGQRRPDGNGRCPDKVQVVINGGCWTKMPIDMKDCDRWGGFEYKDACYFPVMAKPRPSTSSPSDRDGGL